MSRSNHIQHGGAKQWNPPKLKKDDHLPLDRTQNIASAMECTGLESQPVTTAEAAANYTQLYGIHAQKPQGNIGKGNPRNDPSEIAFHRTQNDG